MHLLVRNGVTCIRRDGDQQHTSDLRGKEEARCDGTKETEKAVHAHVDKEKHNKESEESTGGQVQTHHKVRTDFKQQDYQMD